MMDPEAGHDPAEEPATAHEEGTAAHDVPGFLPSEPARRNAESVFVRLVATAGIIGIGTLLGALLSAGNVAGWIIGIVVSFVSVLLAAVLWRSRTL